jgi:hypothetical protein
VAVIEGAGAEGAVAVGVGVGDGGFGVVLVGEGADVVGVVSSLQLAIPRLSSNTTTKEMKSSFFIFPPN